MLERLGLAPASVAGHSLGELTAVAAAGGIREADVLLIARRRGELCAKAGGVPGAMLAVTTDVASAERLLRDWGGGATIANHNAPNQVVLSGAASAIDAAEQRFGALGIAARRLPVSTAFHSPLVGGACAPFREFLHGIAIAPTRVPVFSNATAAVYPANGDEVRDRLAAAIAEPVRFVAQIEAMYAAGARTFVEVGPDAILTKLVGRCLTDRAHLGVATDVRGKHGVTALWEALARLSTGGVVLQYAELWKGEAATPEASTEPRPKLSVLLSGANYGKPYPDGVPALAAAPDVSRGKVASAVAAHTNGVASHPKAASPANGTSSHAGAAVPTNGITSHASSAAPATSVASAAPRVTAPDATASSLLQLHAPAIAAQMEFQRLMAESHMAFLRAIEASYASLGHAAVGPPMPLTAPPAYLAPPAAPQGAVSAHPAAPASLAMPATRETASPPAASSPDLVVLLRAIVAEKTGYPAEMIEPTMDLEDDLGIDSIKRVEILSAVRERAPGLPQVDPARMATMRTLAEIVAFLGAGALDAAPANGATAVARTIAVASVPQPTKEPARPQNASATADLVGLMLSIVAEKTGYPAEMIEPTMDLEADLGIDSIKRVEILSAVRERAPGLPQVDPARMAAMRTLAEIVAFLGGSPGDSPAQRLSTHAPTAAAPREPPLEVGRLGVRAVPRAARGLALHGLLGAVRVAVTSDGGGIAAALVQRLRGRGVAAAIVDSVPADADVVIFLGGVKPVGRIEEALAINREAFATAREVSARFSRDGGAFVTVQDTGGDFGIEGTSGVRAWLGGIGALAKTAAEEWPLATARAIDLERGSRSDDQMAEVLFDELVGGGPEIEVGLRASGIRVAIDDVLLPSPASAPSASTANTTDHTIPPRALFVVSGGGRGVTAASIIALAKAARPTFLLLGRSPVDEESAAFAGIVGDAELKRAALAEAKRTATPATPKDIAQRVEAVAGAREIRETLRRLADAGAEARYAVADVRDPRALAPVLAAARRDFGPVRGVVHGAGVLSDALLDKKTDAQFDRVFDTKVLGLRGLLEATSADPLAWLCLFSSVAARRGNAGQGDYAMANEVLNHVATVEARRRGGRCRVVSIGWGPWEGGMVTPALRSHFKSRGVKLLPVDQGAEAFVRELCVGPSGTAGVEADVRVVIGGDAGLRAPGMASKIQSDILVDERTWPQLASHRIQGRVVLPMVVALEWFARLVEPLVGASGALHLRDLHAVRGVPLAGFLDGASERFHVIGRPDAEGGLDLELRDARGGLRYSAKLDRGPPPTNGHGSIARAGLAARPPLPASPWTRADLYGPSTLFHGAHFQVLRSIDGMSMTEAHGMLVGTREAGWPDQEWYADPAALDGALQLAILFGLHSGGATTLPLRIARVVYHRTTESGPIRCALKERHRTKERLLCDLSLAHAGGENLADLIGVEMFTVPSGTTVAQAE